MSRITITARVTACLVFLLVGSLMAANGLGLMPDSRKAAMAGRRDLCESLAISSSILASQGNMQGIETNLRAVAGRNDNILSAGLRRSDDRIVVEVGQHEAHWGQGRGGHSSASHIVVPIMANDAAWGTVEVRFAPLSSSGLMGFVESTQFRCIAFVCALSLLLFYMFLRKILHQLDPTNVVPQRVRAALDTLAEGLLVLDNNERIVLANRAFAKTMGRQPEDLQGWKASALPWQTGKEGEKLAMLPWETSECQDDVQRGASLSLRVGESESRTFMVNTAPIAGADGKHRGVLASFGDVTDLEAKRAELARMLESLQNSRLEIQRQNKELQLLAAFDPLTACLNRRAFFDEAEKQWSLARRHNEAVSCIMLDVDHFKSVNDNHGHSTGDLVLKKVSAALRKTARNTDIVCRYGGEEFVVLLPHSDITEALDAAERLRMAVANLVFKDLSVTASFGVSCINPDSPDLQALLDQADRALYSAKETGRNRSVCWRKSLDSIQAENSSSSQSTAPVPAEQDVEIPFHAVTALLSALAYRDSGTAAHSARVADLSVMLARGIMSVRETYILEMAALLHDIGKIGVPDSILLKPGPLTEEEWKLMGTHDHVGVEILRSSFACPALAEIVDTHHAFYGGLGRNHSLPTGDEIPMGARILTICDAYDAMVSDRVYRKGMPRQDAFIELRRCAGTQFDPVLVEKFIEGVEQAHVADAPAAASVGKEAALQIGIQIEHLARALDENNFEELKARAGRLKNTAAKSGIIQIAKVAAELEECDADDPDVSILVGITHDLLDLCRSTQKAYIDVASCDNAREPDATLQT